MIKDGLLEPSWLGCSEKPPLKTGRVYVDFRDQMGQLSDHGSGDWDKSTDHREPCFLGAVPGALQRLLLLPEVIGGAHNLWVRSGPCLFIYLFIWQCNTFSKAPRCWLP